MVNPDLFRFVLFPSGGEGRGDQEGGEGKGIVNVHNTQS